MDNVSPDSIFNLKDTRPSRITKKTNIPLDDGF